MPVNAGFWPGSRLDRIMHIPGPAKPAQGTAPAATLSLVGIASGAILGNSSLAASIGDIGITSAARIGNESDAPSIKDVGVASYARLGNESIAASLADLGIASGAKVGDQVVNPLISSVGIPLATKFGNTVVFSGIILYPTAIPSGAKVGNLALASSIGLVGIPAATKLGSSSFSTSIFATGIASGAKFGDQAIAASISAVGIRSSSTVGNEIASSSVKPAGIPSGVLLGSSSTALSMSAIGIASKASPGLPSLAEVLMGIGIPLEGAVGIPQIVPQTFTVLNLVGIPSSSEVGNLAIWYVPQIAPPPLADAIYQYVNQVLESIFDPPTIIWEYEGGPRPNVFPYLSLNIVGARGIGQAWQSPVTPGGQATFLPKDWTIRLNGWGAGSRDLVEAIRQSLEAPWWLDELESLGLAYRGASQPRAAHRIIDFSPEHGWSMDVTFGVTAELAQAIAAWIEFAIISGTIVAPDGTQQVLPPVTVGQ